MGTLFNVRVEFFLTVLLNYRLHLSNRLWI